MNARREARLLLVAALALAAIAGGCARAPGPGAPLSPAGLADFVTSLEAPWKDVEALRGAGSADIRISGRTLHADFAIAYSAERWARFDIRPKLGSLGTSLTALGMIEGSCARAYFPARVLEIHGCLGDLASFERPPDLAPLLVGAVDAAFLLGLERATLAVGERSTILRGESGGLTVELEIENGLVTRLALEDGSGADVFTVRYGRSDDGSPMPATVEMDAADTSGDGGRAGLRFSSLRPSDAIARGDYEPTVPEGAPSVHWRELNARR